MPKFAFVVSLLVLCFALISPTYANALPKPDEHPSAANDSHYPKPKNPNAANDSHYKPKRPSIGKNFGKIFGRITQVTTLVDIALEMTDYVMDPENTTPKKKDKDDEFETIFYAYPNKEFKSADEAAAYVASTQTFKNACKGGYTRYDTHINDKSIYYVYCMSKHHDTETTGGSFGKTTRRKMSAVPKPDIDDQPNPKTEPVPQPKPGTQPNQPRPDRLPQTAPNDPPARPKPGKPANDPDYNPPSKPERDKPKTPPAPSPSPSAPPTTTPSTPATPATPAVPGTNPDKKTNPDKEKENNPDKDKDDENNPDKKTNPDKEKENNPDKDKDKDKDDENNPSKNPDDSPDKDPNKQPDDKKDPQKNPDKSPDKENDKDPNANPKTGTQTTTTFDVELDFEFPEFCTWAKPVCDFIEWVKEEPELEPEEVKTETPRLKNPAEFDRQHINAGKQCPPDVVKTFNTGFAQNEIRFEMKPICDFAHTYMRPVIIFLAYISAVISIGNAFKVGG